MINPKHSTLLWLAGILIAGFIGFFGGLLSFYIFLRVSDLVTIPQWKYELITRMFVEYAADDLPQDADPPWEARLSPQAAVGADAGIFRIDTTQNLTELALFSQNWGASNAKGSTVEARMRLNDYSGDPDSGGAAIWVEDDKNAEAILIRPGGISLYAAHLAYEVDTKDYHVYKIVAAGRDILVYVDGSLAIDGTGTYGSNEWPARNMIAFGDGSGGSAGYSSWDYVSYYPGFQIQDKER